MFIRILAENQQIAWDNYVKKHPRGTVYHIAGWQKVIEKTYAHRTYYLMAIEDKPELMAHKDSKEKIYDLTATSYELNSYSVVGILPLVHIKHFIFGNSLISMPFLDYGGILADDQEIEKALLLHGTELGRELKVRRIELRQIEPLSWINEINSINSSNPSNPLTYETKSHKVLMTLKLPESSEILMKSLKPRLRTKIRKPTKEGLISKIGRLELLEDFYNVFSVNMRDLGSPVHSKELMKHVLEQFPDSSKIVVVYKDNQPMACGLIVGFKDTLGNPWISALRKYSRLYPNILLYWTILEYARENGFTYFEFGRSSPGEGTYEFKKQWGAEPKPLHWHYVSLDGRTIDMEASEKSKFRKVIKCWQQLPVPFTKIIGPSIRKYIGL